MSSDNKSSDDNRTPIPRRDFLKGAGAAGTAVAATVAAGAAVTAAAAQQQPTAPPAAVQHTPDTWLTLNATEVAFITAAVDTIIPADDLSPSGSDCGVAVSSTGNSRAPMAAARGSIARARSPRPSPSSAIS